MPFSLRLSSSDKLQRLRGQAADAREAGTDSSGRFLARDISGDIVELKEAHSPEHIHEHLFRAVELIRGLDGEEGHTNASASEAMEALEQLIDADLPVQLLAQLPYLEFEARKDVMNVCCTLLRQGLPQHLSRRVVGYFSNHPTFFSILFDGYRAQDLAGHCGEVLRSCMRHEELLEAFLQSGKLFDLVKFAQSPSIEISSDAFGALRELLIEHKAAAALWLEANYAPFFQLFNGLLRSGDYCAERQAQKLLVDMFLNRERHFQKTMLEYVSNEENLVITMNLLKDHSKVIQNQAFQLFQVFVANPAKPLKIQRILCKNKEKLVALLASFQPLKPESVRFLEDVQKVIQKLNELAPPPMPAAKKPAASERTPSTCPSESSITSPRPKSQVSEDEHVVEIADVEIGSAGFGCCMPQSRQRKPWTTWLSI